MSEGQDTLVKRLPEGFTKGPWKFAAHESDAGDEVYGFYVESGTGHDILYFDADDKPRTEANARLIALAPEMADRIKQQAAEIARLREAAERGLEHAIEQANASTSDLELQNIMRDIRKIEAALSATPDAVEREAGAINRVEHCRIGSCHRHAECMYRPCRASFPEPTSPTADVDVERVAELLGKMRAQLHVWEDEELRADWWNYQREYGEAFLLLNTLHPTTAIAERSA